MAAAMDGAQAAPVATLAVFIDADNLNDATALDHVLTTLRQRVERVVYKRAYGRAESLRGIEATLWRHGVRPVANMVVNKTTTDSALVIDAVEAVCTGDIEAVAICSGDADFVPLATWLREKGCRVWCYSLEGKVFANPESFYDEVVEIAVVAAPPERPAVAALLSAPARAPSARPAPLREPRPPAPELLDAALAARLQQAVRAAQKPDGWALVSHVGLQLGGKAQFDPRHHGYETLTQLLKEVEGVELRAAGTPRVAARWAAGGGPPTAPALAAPTWTAPTSAAPVAVGNWHTPQARLQGVNLRPPLHRLRCVLLELAVRQITEEDILRAAPELALGRRCALIAVTGRLREHGVILPSQTALRLFRLHRDAFEIDLVHRPQWIRYLR